MLLSKLTCSVHTRVCCELVLNFFCRFLVEMENNDWSSERTVIENCSAGTMLRGVLYCDYREFNGFDMYTVTTSTLVKTPHNQKYLKPECDKSVDHFEFETEKELRRFQKSFATTYEVLDAGMVFHGPSLGAGIDANRSRNATDSMTSEDRDQRKFYSEVDVTRYAVVSLRCDKSDLELSGQAYKALREIIFKSKDYRRYDDIDRRRIEFDLCASFFVNFGSHGRCGLFHLGGIHTTTAIFHGKTTSSLKKVKEDTKTALKAAVDVGYSEIGLKACGEKKQAKENITENFDMDLDKNIQVNCKTNGGDNITKEFTKDDWIAGLKQNNWKWALINRDPGPNDLVEVWSMIPENSFGDDTSRLIYMLSNNYSSYMYRRHMKSIMDGTSSKTIIVQSLQDLAKTNGEYIYKHGSNQNWKDFVRADGSVPDYLLNPRRFIPNIQTNDLECIADAVAKLLDHFGMDHFGVEDKFPRGDDIKEMVEDIRSRAAER